MSTPKNKKLLPEIDSQPETILLVDDEESIRKVLSISLLDSGFKVLTAENGKEALRIFRKNAPSIVLTDIKMPGMNGTELLKKIKSEKPDTEVIMISGHGDMDLAIKSLKLDATDFITKPINDDALEIALKRACERIKMRRQLKEHTDNLEALVKEKSAKLIEAERVAAISKAFEGISSAIWNMAGDLEGGIKYFNEMPCLVSLHNKDMKIIATNQLFQERFGEKIGKNSWDIYPAKAGNPEECPAGRTYISAKGQRSNEIVHYINGMEAPVIVHTSPIRDKKGNVEFVLEISADMTEVNHLQEKLRETEQNYQKLFDEVPCFITVQDRDLKIIDANRRFKENFGDTKNKYCYFAYKNQTSPCQNCPVMETFKDGESHNSEMVVMGKNGEQINLFVSTAPVKSSSGKVTQVMEMATDITQIRKLQDHLSSLGLKIGTISHGIKGLLTGLDGGMYMLDSGFSRENKEKIEEGWEIVKLMVDRIRNMTLDILYYAKERDLKWEYIDAFSFAKDLAFTIDPEMKKYDIQFVCEFDPDSGSFEIDSGVVRSALLNILENAIDACKEDKTNQIKRIVFSVKKDERNIIFAVSDNGIGMDKETIKNLFTLFFSSKENRGTGLGLFIADKIIRQHGGRIRVESTIKKGSTLTVTMPKKAPKSKARSQKK